MFAARLGHDLAATQSDLIGTFLVVAYPRDSVQHCVTFICHYQIVLTTCTNGTRDQSGRYCLQQVVTQGSFRAMTSSRC